MGTVYAATHERLGREVAVKILRPDLCSHRESAARFQREAELVTRLGHPSIVAVYDFGNAPDGGLYYVMELIAGRTLRARLDEGPLSDAEIVSVFAPLLSALQVAHAVGVVHRDLKPDEYGVGSKGDSGDAAALFWDADRMTCGRNEPRCAGRATRLSGSHASWYDDVDPLVLAPRLSSPGDPIRMPALRPDAPATLAALAAAKVDRSPHASAAPVRGPRWRLAAALCVAWLATGSSVAEAAAQGVAVLPASALAAALRAPLSQAVRQALSAAHVTAIGAAELETALSTDAALRDCTTPPALRAWDGCCAPVP